MTDKQNKQESVRLKIARTIAQLELRELAKILD